MITPVASSHQHHHPISLTVSASRGLRDRYVWDGLVRPAQVPVTRFGRLILNPAFHRADLERSGFSPFPDLGMAVCETQPTTCPVASGGEVDPRPFGGRQHGEAGVVDAPLVLVNEHESLGGRWDSNL